MDDLKIPIKNLALLSILSSLLFVCIIASTFFFLEINVPIYLYILLLLVNTIFLFFVFYISFKILLFRILKRLFKFIIRAVDPSSELKNFKDLKVLIHEIKKYATDKRLEIITLKHRDSFRKEFMGNLAHEFKTPLFTVQGYILTLLDGAGNDEALRKKYLERTAKGVERLIHIVNDLDFIAKLEENKLNMNFEVFEINDVILNVFDLSEIDAMQKKITLTLDRTSPKVKVYADKEKINQVLSNLVYNSIKYGKEKGTTEVSIEDYNKNHIIIKVSDNGVGIEKKNLTRVFERFYRIDKSRNRSIGGSGLGLSIVKHIIQSHGQKIFVESRFGIGSEFSFTLEKAKSTKLLQDQISQLIVN